jgi:hypothetical protein
LDRVAGRYRLSEGAGSIALRFASSTLYLSLVTARPAAVAPGALLVEGAQYSQRVEPVNAPPRKTFPTRKFFAKQ